MIILLKKHMKRELFFKERKLKSIRAGKVNLKDSYAESRTVKSFLYSMHVSPYEQGNRYNHDPLRTRKLLLHKREIAKLMAKQKKQAIHSFH